jgi:hypothetical protein
MSTNVQPPRAAGAARPARDRDEPRRFAGRVKRWSLSLAVVGFGLAWGLVSQNVVGATNASSTSVTANSHPTNGAAAPAGTSGRAIVPSPDFFGQPAAQPQPIFGNGSGGPPVVSGRTS